AAHFQIESGAEKPDTKRLSVPALLVSFWHEREELVQYLVVGLPGSRLKTSQLLSSLRAESNRRHIRLLIATLPLFNLTGGGGSMHGPSTRANVAPLMCSDDPRPLTGSSSTAATQRGRRASPSPARSQGSACGTD